MRTIAWVPAPTFGMLRTNILRYGGLELREGLTGLVASRNTPIYGYYWVVLCLLFINSMDWFTCTPRKEDVYDKNGKQFPHLQKNIEDYNMDN